MANRVLEGRYQGKVCGVSVGEIGVKNTAAIEVDIKPYSELVGADFVIGEFPKVRKTYWLGDTIGSSGKTSLEVSRSQMKEAFGYNGALVLSDIETALVGRDVEISCVPNEKGYTEVKYVNPPGGSGKGLKRLKLIPENKLAKLAAMWSGNAPVEKAVDPAALFASFTEKNEGAA